jgi:hypothetical protein
MIIWRMPLFAWLGVLVFLLIITQICLGIAMTKYQKNVFKYHRINGFTILLLGITHMTLALLFLLKGIVV